jgi:3-methyladenine DNA glycosylase AlkD
VASAAVRSLQKEIRAMGTAARAKVSLTFFRTGPGEYGEGDRFLGLTVPQVRALARKHRDLPLSDIEELLHSKWHEERLLALAMLTAAHERGSDREKRAIRKLYLANTEFVNNWDLVDCSAGQIVGYHLDADGTKLVERLAKSKSLWERRIAMIATFFGIKRGAVAPALMIAERLLDDEHDLIHKAVGWMLREVGKKDGASLRGFLDKHAATMPRTALRYAIERFAADERKLYMGKRTVSSREA